MTLPKEPLSRTEQYLNVLATGEGELPNVPQSRIEQYLNYMCTNSSGGSSESYVSDFGVLPQSIKKIYSYGNEYLLVTGGWKEHYFLTPSGGISKKKEDSLYSQGTGGKYAGFVTMNPIDLINAKKISITLSMTGSYNAISVGLATTNNPGNISSGGFNRIHYEDRISSTKTLNIDLSNVDKSKQFYHIAFFVEGIGSTATSSVYNIEIEYDISNDNANSIKEVKELRGYSEAVETYRGVEGQVIVNLSTNKLHIMDGVLLGGHIVGDTTELENRIAVLEEKINALNL